MRIDPARWKNRRRMAWICLLTGCAYPALVLFTKSNELSQIAWPYFTFVGSVVGAYIGFATYDDVAREKYALNRKPNQQ